MEITPLYYQHRHSSAPEYSTNHVMKFKQQSSCDVSEQDFNEQMNWTQKHLKPTKEMIGTVTLYLGKDDE